MTTIKVCVKPRTPLHPLWKRFLRSLLIGHINLLNHNNFTYPAFFIASKDSI